MNRRRFLIRSGCAIVGASLYAPVTRISGRAIAKPGTKVFTWERGIAIESRAMKDMAMFLWFYEWTMFDAVRRGQHTFGRFEDFQRSANLKQTEASTNDNEFQLTAKASDVGADLLLQVTNKSDYDWPKLAAIIPCLNPGMLAPNLGVRGAEGPPTDVAPPRTPAFANEKSFFLGPTGLEPLNQRDIHFNRTLRPDIDAAAYDGRFVFSQKWPTALPDAYGGIIMRESTDGAWVSGIAWDDFLSVQAHNPWRCMHLAVRVGPLKRNEAKTIRGKIYLFRGTKEDCLRHYRADFRDKKFSDKQKAK